MERNTWAREKYERNTTESGLVIRNSKVSHKRKSRAPFREWQTTGYQLNEKGIEEYKHNNLSECCSEVYIVVPTGEHSSTIMTQETEPEKALISKSEYDITKPDSGIFNRDSIGSYLYNVQSKTSVGEKDKLTRTTDSRKNGRTGSLQKRHVFRHTYRECSAASIKTLELDTITPREESFVYQTLVNKPRPKPHSGGKHQRKNCHINNNHLPITCLLSNSDEQVTCPSHVYTFNRGLVPSREAHSLELFHNQHFLPPVVADRIGNISEQKHYRLSREKGGKSSNNANYFLNSLYSNDQSFEPKTESKSVVYKEFSAETVIPAAYGNRRYFDLQGYIDFLCKERNLRKTSARTSRGDYDWERLESSSWLNNLGDVLGYCRLCGWMNETRRMTNVISAAAEHKFLAKIVPESCGILIESSDGLPTTVKDVFDYSRVLDIKGSRMKLDENPVQMKCQTKPLSEPRQHCFLGNSNTIYFKSQKPLKVTQSKSRKPKEKTVLIERLPSKFQFTLPGRPPSSDDSGFAE